MPRRTPSKTPFSVRLGNGVVPKKYRHAASVANQERRHCADDAECVYDLAVVASPLRNRRIVDLDERHVGVIAKLVWQGVMQDLAIGGRADRATVRARGQ